MHYRVEYLRTVPAGVFLPRPEVDSAFVKITQRPQDELPDFDRDRFTRLVRLGFSQRRKQLQKLLRDEVPDWEHATAVCGCDSKARAEELSLRQWIDLSNSGAPQSSGAATPGHVEFFPVVDEHDRLIGQAPRAEVHGDNLRHRAVHILLFNRKGELFLQKRSRHKDRHPCVWDSSAAGHVDAGEDYDAAAARELQEALIVNPYDIDQCAAALHLALTMPLTEQRARMLSMRGTVQEFNVYRWAGRMLMDAARIRQRARVMQQVGDRKEQISGKGR